MRRPLAYMVAALLIVSMIGALSAANAPAAFAPASIGKIDSKLAEVTKEESRRCELKALEDFQVPAYRTAKGKDGKTLVAPYKVDGKQVAAGGRMVAAGEEVAFAMGAYSTAKNVTLKGSMSVGSLVKKAYISPIEQSALKVEGILLVNLKLGETSPLTMTHNGETVRSARIGDQVIIEAPAGAAAATSTATGQTLASTYRPMPYGWVYLSEMSESTSTTGGSSEPYYPPTSTVTYPTNPVVPGNPGTVIPTPRDPAAILSVDGLAGGLMELIWTEFKFTVSSADGNAMVMANIKLDDGVNAAAYQLEYYEPNGASPGWYTLPMAADPDTPTGTMGSFGPPVTGFPLQKGSSRFRIKAPAGSAGNLSYKVELVNVATGAVLSDPHGTVPVTANPDTKASLTFTGSSDVTRGVSSEFDIVVGDVSAPGAMVMGHLAVTGGDITDIEYYEANVAPLGWYSMPASGDFGPPVTGFPLMSGASSSFRYTPPANLPVNEIQHTITLTEVATGTVVAQYNGTLQVS